MKQVLHIRSAIETDLPDIIALLADDEIGRQREDPSMPPNSHYLEAFRAISEDDNQFLIIGEFNGQVSACLQLSIIPGLSRIGQWRGQIESVRVSGACRGKGFGHELLQWAIQECRRRQCGLVQLTTDKHRNESRRFYESLGFSASHDGMKLSLSP